MGQLARASLTYEDSLYRLLGVNAELIIDHAWGWEAATIAQVKAYRPETNSTSSGQVLTEAYTMEKTLVVVQEMARRWPSTYLRNISRPTSLRSPSVMIPKT